MHTESKQDKIKKNTPQRIIFKTLNMQNKEKILKTAEEKNTNHNQENSSE